MFFYQFNYILRKFFLVTELFFATIQINAFENGKGEYIFLGADEKKKGISKIVGLNSYLSKKSITLDKLKRDI